MGGSNSKGVEWLERVNIKDGFNLDECKKLWVSYDRNKSNILDSKEVEAFCQDYAKAQRITERCKVQALTFDFINTFDLDGSGSIDWKELGTQTSESYIQTTPSCAAPRWSKCALDGPAPSSRNSHKAVMLGDLCIIFGGRKGSSRRNTNEILIQDYVSMQWFRPELGKCQYVCTVRVWVVVCKDSLMCWLQMGTGWCVMRR